MSEVTRVFQRVSIKLKVFCFVLKHFSSPKRCSRGPFKVVFFLSEGDLWDSFSCS